MPLPPLGNLVIPGVAAGIARVQARLGLTPQVSARSFLAQVGDAKHRYVSRCATRAGATVAFYARLHANRDAQAKFLTEIRLLQYFRRHQPPFATVVPKLLAWGRTPNFEWFTREYPLARPLGSSRRLAHQPSQTVATAIGRTVAQIGTLPVRHLPFRIRAFRSDDYRIVAQCASIAGDAGVPARTCTALQRKFTRARTLLVRGNRTLAHGDLNLGNLLATDEQFWIIDWEQVHVNNFAYDIGYLWAHLWQAPRPIRRAVLAGYLAELPARRHHDFQTLLPLVVAYLCMGGVTWRAGRREDHAELLQRRRYYLQLLQRCAGPFQTLIDT